MRAAWAAEQAEPIQEPEPDDLDFGPSTKFEPEVIDFDDLEDKYKRTTKSPNIRL